LINATTVISYTYCGHTGHKETICYYKLDLGATNHVSSSLTQFSSFIAIKLILVKLPMRQHVCATRSRNVHFSNSLHLIDVLDIPSFTLNLISISKLMSSLHYELLVSHNS